MVLSIHPSNRKSADCETRIKAATWSRPGKEQLMLKTRNGTGQAGLAPPPSADTPPAEPMAANYYHRSSVLASSRLTAAGRHHCCHGNILPGLLCRRLTGSRRGNRGIASVTTSFWLVHILQPPSLRLSQKHRYTNVWRSPRSQRSPRSVRTSDLVFPCVCACVCSCPCPVGGLRGQRSGVRDPESPL